LGIKGPMTVLKLLLLLSASLGFLVSAAAQDSPDGSDQPEAKDAYMASGYPLPRFVAINTREVYMRAGPDTRFPIQWVYHRKGLPLEVFGEFEHWRRVRDAAGDEGWIHKSMLTGKRTAIVKDQVAPMRRGSNELADVLAEVEPGVVVDIVRCPNATAFCRVSADGYEGWIARSNLWGVYADEAID